MLEKDNDEDEGTLKEYAATVISVVPGFPAWFNLKYDGADDIYVEKLQEEMKNGNVFLMNE